LRVDFCSRVIVAIIVVQTFSLQLAPIFVARRQSLLLMQPLK
jgi:hypothetical protein